MLLEPYQKKAVLCSVCPFTSDHVYGRNIFPFLFMWSIEVPYKNSHYLKLLTNMSFIFSRWHEEGSPTSTWRQPYHDRTGQRTVPLHYRRRQISRVKGNQTMVCTITKSLINHIAAQTCEGSIDSSRIDDGTKLYTYFSKRLLWFLTYLSYKIYCPHLKKTDSSWKE